MTLHRSPLDALPFVDIPHGETAIELSSLDIQAVIKGVFAETTWTMRFYNPNARPLEGSLVFPLPDGAAVCGYALDVNGRLVDGVIVPKQEARRILEAEVRKGVDPGLVEQVQGNVYRTRIYPLPARGSRTVRITCVSDLTVRDRAAAWHLPLSFAADLKAVTLKVEVVQPPVAPTISGGIGNLTMSRWGERWVAEATLSRGVACDDLSVRLPDLPDTFVATERADDGAVVFAISERLPAEVAAPWSPRRIAIAWDASGSCGEGRRSLDLIEALAKRWPELHVELVVFRDVVDPIPRSFSISGGRADGLIAALEALPRDGGTRLSALDLSTAPGGAEAWLLFSDGMATLGEGLPKLGGLPVFTITAQASCNSALLKHLALQTGATFTNLLRVDVAQAAASIRPRAGAVIAAQSGCADVHTRVDGGRITVLGRLVAQDGSISIGKGASPVTLSAASATPGAIVARGWAAMEIAAVEARGDSGGEALALGRRFGIVTSGSSLLVLESLEQYLEYDIEPPASLPELRAAWAARRRHKDHEGENKRARQIDSVLALWKTRVQWFETDFTPAPAQEKLKRRADESPSATGSFGPLGGAPPPRPGSPPVMAAPMAAPMPARALSSMAPMPSVYDAYEAESAGASMDFMEAEVGRVDRSRSREIASDGGEGGHDSQGSRGAAVRIQAWEPTAPYLDAMRRAAEGGAYAAYVQARPQWQASPAFFLDCADLLLSKGPAQEGLRVLTNLLELGLDDPALMRMAAWRAQQAGALDLAVEIFERVLKLRDDEPQSHRDLALALGQRWEAKGQAEDALRAMALLVTVVMGSWDRFPEIEIIALMELNQLIDRARRAGLQAPADLDPRLIKALDLDLRISMSWDADLTDVDLHVYEPDGSHAYYGNLRTPAGGLASRDFRQGYGPEEYVIRKALPGRYTIKAHYYGSSQQAVCGPCTVIVQVFTHYGRPEQTRQTLTLRLDKPSDQVLVGEIDFAAAIPAIPSVRGWRATFERLRRGMSAGEVKAILGDPQNIQGDEAVVLVYRPEPGVTVHAHLAPRLTAVRLVTEGAEIDLI